MKINRYPVYKDSGIEWLGNVPEHWTVKRIKEVAYINKKALTDKTPNDYEFDYIDIGSVTYGIKGFSSERITFENSPSRARRIVKKGDTIISTVRTYLKAIASIDNDVSDLIVSTGFAVVSPKKSIFSKYFSYWLTSNFIIDKICALSTGVSYPATNSSAIGNLFCLSPSLPEQKAIAHYLDTKTAQIDRKIDLLTQKAALYGNLKQSLINETVTRGLDKSVPMKDSGVEWIGEVPEHWALNRHKDNFNFVNEKCNDTTFVKVGLENIESKTGQFISTESEFDGDGIEFKEDDILLGKLRPYLAKVYLAKFKGNAVGDIFVYRSKRNTQPEFAYYFMISSKYIDVINSSTVGAKMPRVSSNFIANLIVVTPPLSEQKAIAHYLDTKTAQIDKIIQTINTQIEKLRELRKTLINDVVTGKIKVINDV